ncbi:uncharacterized protein AB675_7429 [Cyphellophora attinorum]|uniref:Uncharacterized protein n=1 Tax=Cyphellophora attinorum TaxID=1664694 RepID=A0A0N1HJV4_9EURO|nr:uncharacterized protein AB675_7429 [Phialophora attinorum]KPI34332.1 hypothetical protein AB675_7429 [Phialophora attinorum]
MGATFSKELDRGQLDEIDDRVKQVGVLVAERAVGAPDSKDVLYSIRWVGEPNMRAGIGEEKKYPIAVYFGEVNVTPENYNAGLVGDAFVPQLEMYDQFGQPMTDRSETPKKPATPGGIWRSKLKSKWKKKSYPTYLTVRIVLPTDFDDAKSMNDAKYPAGIPVQNQLYRGDIVKNQKFWFVTTWNEKEKKRKLTPLGNVMPELKNGGDLKAKREDGGEGEYLPFNNTNTNQYGFDYGRMSSMFRGLYSITNSTEPEDTAEFKCAQRNFVGPDWYNEWEGRYCDLESRRVFPTCGGEEQGMCWDPMATEIRGAREVMEPVADWSGLVAKRDGLTTLVGVAATKSVSAAAPFKTLSAVYGYF